MCCYYQWTSEPSIRHVTAKNSKHFKESEKGARTRLTRHATGMADRGVERTRQSLADAALARTNALAAGFQGWLAAMSAEQALCGSLALQLNNPPTAADAAGAAAAPNAQPVGGGAAIPAGNFSVYRGVLCQPACLAVTWRAY